MKRSLLLLAFFMFSCGSPASGPHVGHPSELSLLQGRWQHPENSPFEYEVNREFIVFRLFDGNHSYSKRVYRITHWDVQKGNIMTVLHQIKGSRDNPEWEEQEGSPMCFLYKIEGGEVYLAHGIINESCPNYFPEEIEPVARIDQENKLFVEIDLEGAPGVVENAHYLSILKKDGLDVQNDGTPPVGLINGYSGFYIAQAGHALNLAPGDYQLFIYINDNADKDSWENPSYQVGEKALQKKIKIENFHHEFFSTDNFTPSVSLQFQSPQGEIPAGTHQVCHILAPGALLNSLNDGFMEGTIGVSSGYYSAGALVMDYTYPIPAGTYDIYCFLPVDHIWPYLISPGNYQVRLRNVEIFGHEVIQAVPSRILSELDGRWTGAHQGKTLELLFYSPEQGIVFMLQEPGGPLRVTLLKYLYFDEEKNQIKAQVIESDAGYSPGDVFWFSYGISVTGALYFDFYVNSTVSFPATALIGPLIRE